MNPTNHSSSFTVPLEHPSLPGHFPGRPVVPGVLLVEAAIAACERWTGAARPVLALPQVKFLQPLLPGQQADIELVRSGERVRFRISRGATLIASGEFDLAP